MPCLFLGTDSTNTRVGDGANHTITLADKSLGAATFLGTAATGPNKGETEDS